MAVLGSKKLFNLAGRVGNPYIKNFSKITISNTPISQPSIILFIKFPRIFFILKPYSVKQKVGPKSKAVVKSII